jgi:hypothetical protein
MNAPRARRKVAGAAEMKPRRLPNSPAEALDRITIPPDAMARIAEALTTGGSIIVSDQGINAGRNRRRHRFHRFAALAGGRRRFAVAAALKTLRA